MPAVPVVAIVGRPNVGKSTLFNALAGRRIAIVEARPGVTRDRLATRLAVGERAFDLVDTGGIGMVDAQALEAHVEHQIQSAIQESALVLFVVDVRSGAQPLDHEVAQRLRALGRPVLVVANKCDTQELEQGRHEHWSLGLGEPLPCAAQERYGISEILEWIAGHLPAPADGERPGAEEIKIAIVGRRNVGKSTFVNALLGQERVIVSDIPGTTRDSVDVRFEHEGRGYVLIDTAGLRRRGRLDDGLEFYARHRAQRSIRRADVVLLLVDVTQEVSQVEKQLAREIQDEDKPVVLVGNKWDLAAGHAPSGFQEYYESRLPGLHYAPLALVSAQRRERVFDVLSLARDLNDQASLRVPTGELNRVVKAAWELRRPPLCRGVEGKIYYATQVGVQPPQIVLFVNSPQAFNADYRRYLAHQLRSALPYKEVPLRILLRERVSFFEKEPAR